MENWLITIQLATPADDYTARKLKDLFSSLSESIDPGAEITVTFAGGGM